MIQEQTCLRVADNSGAKLVQCIRLLGGTRKKVARVGDVIVVAVKKAIPHASVSKGNVAKAVVVRTRKEYSRDDGTYVRFDENACVLLDANLELKGRRIFGPIPRELRRFGFSKILSLAPEIV